MTYSEFMEARMSVPKIIHYCWLGGPFPEIVTKCFSSWREKLSDYKIICWNADNFDVNICQYTREAFEARKYAFVSDYIRLYALYNYGGIYLDTDVEVLKSFDDLLEEKAFAGFENNHTIASCLFASEKSNPLIMELLDHYSDIHFLLPDGSFDLTPNTVPITKILRKHGLLLDGSEQILRNIRLLPAEYFCPYSRASEELNVTSKSYAIHYFNGAWIPDEKKMIISKRKEVIKKYGKCCGYIYYGLALISKQGIRQFIKEFSFFLKG